MFRGLRPRGVSPGRRRRSRRYQASALDEQRPPFPRGMCIRYVGPEAAVGGPSALLRNGAAISIDAVTETLNVELTEGPLGLSQMAP